MKRQDAEIAEDATVRLIEPDERLDQLAHVVIGAAIEVHKELGPGFMECVYEEALCVELEQRGVPFVRHPTVEIGYKGRTVGEGRLDIWVDKVLVVELKAVDTVVPLHSAQLLSYLKATRSHLGLLINFNVPVLKEGIRRIINSR